MVVISFFTCEKNENWELENTDNTTDTTGVNYNSWAKYFGGSRNEYARKVIQTAEGGYLVAGYTYSNNGDISGNNGYSDYWIVKLDKTGNLNIP